MTAGVGICLGLLTWGFAASVGLGALLSASHIAYNVLRVAGACYMVFLGCKSPVHSTSEVDLHSWAPQIQH
jgi:threonine/homoserine/homoserine lactone efflux protein